MGSKFNVPNQWARLALMAAQPMLTSAQFDDVCRAANSDPMSNALPPGVMTKTFSFERMSAFHQNLRRSLGKAKMTEYATAAGAKIMEDHLSQFPSVAAAAKVAMMVGTLDTKVKLGLEFFGKFYGSVSDQVVNLSDDSGYWFWTISRCPMCTNETSSEPCCELAVGMVQAILHWVSPDTRFDVRETECIAEGRSSCVIQVSKSTI